MDEDFDYENVPSVGITFLSSNEPALTNVNEAQQTESSKTSERSSLSSHGSHTKVNPDMLTGLIEPASQTPDMEKMFPTEDVPIYESHTKKLWNFLRGLCTNFEQTVFEQTRNIDQQISQGTKQLHHVLNHLLTTQCGLPPGKIFDK